MAERNLLREGYIFNTLDPLGAVSGTQIVPISSMNALVDGDTATTALTVSGSEFFSLDADLGARWKLKRIELYTDETQPLNFDMLISDDGVDFHEVTMTGSPGLYVGDISSSTISGAPHYIRYEHRGATDRDIQEWVAVSEDALVEFGADGSQTAATISDAPIGKTSDSITTLALFNAYNKSAVGNVVISSSGTGADNIEIAVGPRGPWYGRKTLGANQPELLGWEQGQFDNTRVVSGTAYKTDWTDGTKRGWGVSGFVGSTVIDYNSTSPSLQGEISTSASPTFQLDNDFINEISSSSPLSSNKPTGFVCRADEFDTVRVNLTTPAIPVDDFAEGVRLFWRDHLGQDYNVAQSTLSTAANANFLGVPQEFVFDVGVVPTWSGVVRSLKIQNFTTVTGVGYSSSLNEVEIYHSSREDRVGLNFSPVVSGTFKAFNDGNKSVATSSAYHTVINTENPILEPCVITMVSAEALPAIRAGLELGTEDVVGWFLVSIKDGHSLPSPGTNFEVKAFASLSDYVYRAEYYTTLRLPVFWKAEPGDMVGLAYRSWFGTTQSTWVYDTTPTGTGIHGGALKSTSWLDLLSSRTTSQVESELNAMTFVEESRRYNIQFEGLSAGRYVQNGNYTSPVVDGGTTPALLSVDLETTEENGTSVNTFTGGAFKTVNARASNVPPNDTKTLGRRVASVGSNVNYTHATSAGQGLQRDYGILRRRYPVGTFSVGPHTWPGIAPGAHDVLDGRFATSNYVLGMYNSEATARQTGTNFEGDNKVENSGRCVFYHEQKEELWILNMVVSGTVTTDARPTWDVYDLDSGDYIRTQHMTGNIPYTFQNNSSDYGIGDAVTWAFEPVSFIPDYDREEIFIITREDQFAIGAGTYHGIILSLEGEFKNVMFRRDTIRTEMYNYGIINSVTRDRHLQNIRSVAYDGKYFHVLTSDIEGVLGGSGDSQDYGFILDAYRLGDDSNDEPDTVSFRSSIDLTTLPNSGIDKSAKDMTKTAQAIAYNEDGGLLYYIVFNPPLITTLRASIVGSQPTETIAITAGPVREDTNNNIGAIPPYLADSFIPAVFGISDGGVYQQNKNAWEGVGRVQQIGPVMDFKYIPSRKTFVELMCYEGHRGGHILRNGHYQRNSYLFRGTCHAFVQEVTAGGTHSVDLPGLPGLEDPLWGALSGTLSYEPVQVDSVLFPNGTYAQVQYQLNSDPSGLYSPYLLRSQITQGLRVGDIPASGTKDIYLRTNIPDGASVNTQFSALKVFWELEES
jgi:hypothetical protein